MSTILKIFLNIYFLFFLVVKINGAHWGYSNPDEWSLDYPNCGGSRQSPVDLRTDKMSGLKVPSDLRWEGYDSDPISMTLQNNGHSVELSATWDNDKVPYICGSILNGEYVFAQLHFHWGPRNDVGSEHTIHNRSLPLEMHMVHYKKEYGSMTEALNYDDGLAVVGLFFEMGRRRNKGIMQLESHKNCIKLPGSKVEIEPFPLDEFRFYFRSDYVAYLGSLTTPPCSEIVTWILPAVPRLVTRGQMAFFRSIELSTDGDHNYRPTMPLNGRILYYI